MNIMERKIEKIMAIAIILFIFYTVILIMNSALIHSIELYELLKQINNYFLGTLDFAFCAYLVYMLFKLLMLMINKD